MRRLQIVIITINVSLAFSNDTLFINPTLGIEFYKPLKWRWVPPSAHWAFYAISKLGGFPDTKCTGRPSWDTVWHGWFRLPERINEYQLSKSVFAEL